jgi:hypothetical protein
MSGKVRNIRFFPVLYRVECVPSIEGVSFSLSELLMCTLLLITFRAITDKANI